MGTSNRRNDRLITMEWKELDGRLHITICKEQFMGGYKLLSSISEGSTSKSSSHAEIVKWNIGKLIL